MTADLIEHIGEVDKRGLYKDHDYLSMFEYCVHHLRCSEAAAYRRIRAARAIRRFESIGALLRDGRLTLEGIALLHPHLDAPDAEELIQKAAGLRTWQVQALVANRQVETVRRDVIRYGGPPPAAAASEAGPTDPLFAATAVPLTTPTESRLTVAGLPTPAPMTTPSATTPRSIRVSFSAGAEFHKLLRRAQSLLRHKYPDGRLEGVLQDALTALLREKDLGFHWENPGPRRGRRRRN